MGEKSGEFATLLYKLLIIEEVMSVKQVAAALEMKEQSLYSRLYGRVRFSVEEARATLGLLADARVADYLLDGSCYVAVPRHDADCQTSADVRAQASSSLFDMTDVMREVEKSLSDDGRIDHRERARIQERLQEAERSLTSLRQTLAELDKRA